MPGVSQFDLAKVTCTVSALQAGLEVDLVNISGLECEDLPTNSQTWSVFAWGFLGAHYSVLVFSPGAQVKKHNISQLVFLVSRDGTI